MQLVVQEETFQFQWKRASWSNLLSQDDVLTASGGDKDVSFLASLVHGGHLVTYGATEGEAFIL